MMYGWYGDWGIGWWIAMAVMMLILLGGLAAVVALLIRAARRSPGSEGSPHLRPDDPERLLAQRFARGEIDEAAYAARIEALRRMS